MLYTSVLVANAFSMQVDALKHATCQNEYSTHAWRGLAKLAICAIQAFESHVSTHPYYRCDLLWLLIHILQM
jgi:hypothetical protein